MNVDSDTYHFYAPSTEPAWALQGFAAYTFPWDSP